MRTKALLFAAVLASAGVASSLAQVYSVNVVGYINKPLPVGFSMVANQLNASPDNKVTTVFPAAEGLTIFKFDGATGGYQQLAVVDGAWEGDNLDMTVSPGEGVFAYTPTATNITFVGEVQLSSTVAVGTGFSIISSAIPAVLPLSGAAPGGAEFPIGEGDVVYQYNPATGGYTQSSYIDGAWEGDLGTDVPAPAVAEAFFFYNAGAAKNWVRTFTVN